MARAEICIMTEQTSCFTAKANIALIPVLQAKQDLHFYKSYLLTFIRSMAITELWQSALFME